MSVTRTLPASGEDARHVAHHVAGLCLAGMVPKQVRTDWPEAAWPGW